MNKLETIRLQKVDGSWIPITCIVQEASGCSAIVDVPDSIIGTQKWSICSNGMIGNIGGNDWRIYELHPEDCARICSRKEA